MWGICVQKRFLFWPNQKSYMKGRLSWLVSNLEFFYWGEKIIKYDKKIYESFENSIGRAKAHLQLQDGIEMIKKVEEHNWNFLAYVSAEAPDALPYYEFVKEAVRYHLKEQEK